MEEKDVIDLYNRLQDNDIEIWVDGGWGVDALLGRQTRPHNDLDIALEKKNVSKLREFLESQGYKEVKLEIDKPHNFVLGDNKGHEIDIHVVVFDDKGNGIYGPIEDGVMYPAGSLTGRGEIEGHTVRCISPEYMIKFHSGYELKEKDFQDVSALCKKFGIDLPEEYFSFKK